MIVGITVRNFRSIRQLDKLPLSAFHVLVGSNGAGKSAFLDAIEFVHDCLVQGPRRAVESRTQRGFADLTWQQRGGRIEIELWLDISRNNLTQSGNLVHYGFAIGQNDASCIYVDDEQLYHQRWTSKLVGKLLGKTPSGKGYYFGEDRKNISKFDLDHDKLALALIPPDDTNYPTANAVKRFLMQGIRPLRLDSQAMRFPRPGTPGTGFEPNGANLARVVGQLLESQPPSSGSRPRWATADSPVGRWAEHLRSALPDLAAIGWARRETDNAEYLLLKDQDGLDRPSWVLSDGTLRLLGLTLPAVLPPTAAVYLVEEPAQGVHPVGLDLILRSLSAIPCAQVLLTTHSPLVVRRVGRDALLCFKRTASGTDVIPGPHHPALIDWDGQPDLGLLFAEGVLG